MTDFPSNGQAAYSLRDAYAEWMRGQAARTAPAPAPGGNLPRHVGIVGAGMAGLYSAMLLQAQGVEVTVLEADRHRVGGRIRTHRFSEEPEQFYEAGAMRIPVTREQRPVFGLINYLNQQEPGRLKEIDYVISQPEGNRVLVNGTRDAEGRVMTLAYANEHPEKLGFDLDDPHPRPAAEEIKEVIKPFADALRKDFREGFKKIVQYDNFSFFTYLTTVAEWTTQKVNYCEVMTSQSNQFHASFPELVIENLDFAQAEWKTMKGGMDRFPEAMADAVGRDRIKLGARVHTLDNSAGTSVRIGYTNADGADEFLECDAVIAAVPPAVLRMWSTPQWSPTKAQAIRTMNYQPLYKIGLRFRERFWEKGERPIRGGQSITDSPSRWVVYPSNGIGSEGPGVLLHYAWMTDAYTWLPQSREERTRLALRDLSRLHPEVDVEGLFTESDDIMWATEWAAGDAKFLPGQFREVFTAGQAPEGNIYFAGEHLSIHHTWILGALDSAHTTCGQILGHLPPHLAPDDAPSEPPPPDYDWTHAIAPLTLPAP